MYYKVHQWHNQWQYKQVQFYARITFLKNIAQIKIMQIEHKIPI
jgi:hypothetical protein